MDATVEVAIPVDARAARELLDERTRHAVGRLVSRVLEHHRHQQLDKLFAAMERLSAEAEARGLTDQILEEELAAHKAERRS